MSATAKEANPQRIKVNISAQLRRMVEDETLVIPPFPAVTAQLVRLVSTRDYGLRDVSRLIMSDEALSASILRAANSALATTSEQTSSVSAAIGRLGADQVVRLAMASTVGRTVYKRGAALQQLRSREWRRALTSAVFCQNLASQRNLDSGEAFTCGLLHDFGKVVTIDCLEQILRAREPAPETLRIWQSLVERYHIQAAGLIAERWRLADPVKEVMLSHHWPERARSHRAAVDLVAACDKVSQLAERQSQVSIEDLAQIPQIAESERRYVARLLPKIAPVVASFQQLDEGRCQRQANNNPRYVLPEETTLRGIRRALAEPAVMLAQYGGKLLRCELNFATSDGVSLNTTEALEENSLVRLRLESDTELDMWVNVTLCRPTKERFYVEGRLFGIGSRVQQAWDSFYLRGCPVQ